MLVHSALAGTPASRRAHAVHAMHTLATVDFAFAACAAADTGPERGVSSMQQLHWLVACRVARL
jgi:invasion protein IalB